MRKRKKLKEVPNNSIILYDDKKYSVLGKINHRDDMIRLGYWRKKDKDDFGWGKSMEWDGTYLHEDTKVEVVLWHKEPSFSD